MSVSQDLDVDRVAAALQESIGLFVRRMRQVQADGELTFPEKSALARLDRAGPSTSAELAKVEQISPQSMGATLNALEVRGLVERQSDPNDGRRVVMSVTQVGLEMLRTRRDARTQKMAQVLADQFTRSELNQLVAAAPLIQRLAQHI